MINYVLDYMENARVVFNSSNELTSVTEGVKLYLLENGIPEIDSREYFRMYLNRSLARIECHDMKQFFLVYPVISQVNQVCIEFNAKGDVSDTRKATLLSDMATLYTCGLGEKYIPSVEVKEILGRLA